MKTSPASDVHNGKDGIKLFQTALTLPKRRRTAFIAICLAFAFTLFFLMPLDLYLNNFIDFNISAGHVALPLLAASMAVFFAVVLVFPLFFRGKALDLVILLLCGAVAAFYVQVLFLNGEMSQLTGNGTDYDINLATSLKRLVFVITIFVPLCVWKGLQDSKNHKNVKWETGILCAAVIILGMQAAGVAAAIPGYNSKIVSGPGYLSYNKAFQLSSEENICVFITDALGVKQVREALEKYPELYEQLDGFTFYENNISAQLGTFRSTVQMLTGEIYTTRYSVTGYWDRAWAGRNIIDILRENGYGSNLLISKTATFGHFDHLHDRADNLSVLNESDVKIKHSQILKTTLNISFGRAMPYFFKAKFFSRFDAGFSNDFFKWPSDDILPRAINNGTDIKFYNHLKTTGLYTQNERKTFALSHLNCAHDKGYRYNPDEDTVELYDDGDSIHGCFAILNEYFRQMKELGIYDNSTIILVADHGSYENLKLGELELTGEITSALFIKPGNTRGNLKKDAESELSNDNFRASIMQIAGLPHDDFGSSYFDIIDGRLPQKRVLYSGYNYGLVYENGKYKITRDGSDLGLRGVYEITGDANDFSNWLFEIQIDD